MLEFTCTEGRRIKGDYDDKIVVSCSDGIVSPPLKWPSQSGRRTALSSPFHFPRLSIVYLTS